VISVFNSGAIVGDTLDQTAGFFEAQGWPKSPSMVDSSIKLPIDSHGAAHRALGAQLFVAHLDPQLE
jgi:hypothetical protein